MAPVGKFQIARMNASVATLDDVPGAVGEAVGERIGVAHVTSLQKPDFRDPDESESPHPGPRFRSNEAAPADICESLWTAAPTLDFALKHDRDARASPQLDFADTKKNVARRKSCYPETEFFTRKRNFSSRHNRPFNISAGWRNRQQFVRFSPQLEFTERGMPEFRYAVEQLKSQWVVSVDGTRVLSCKTKRMALKAARRASVLLRQNPGAEVSCRDGMAPGGGRSPVEARNGCRCSAATGLTR
jgi:hypothetical protein